MPFVLLFSTYCGCHRCCGKAPVSVPLSKSSPHSREGAGGVCPLHTEQGWTDRSGKEVSFRCCWRTGLDCVHGTQSEQQPPTTLSFLTLPHTSTPRTPPYTPTPHPHTHHHAPCSHSITHTLALTMYPRPIYSSPCMVCTYPGSSRRECA